MLIGWFIRVLEPFAVPLFIVRLNKTLPGSDGEGVGVGVGDGVGEGDAAIDGEGVAEGVEDGVGEGCATKLAYTVYVVEDEPVKSVEAEFTFPISPVSPDHTGDA